ncbi:MAG: hypothetical protein JRN20_13600 [Nitrososphaerota archaeon]|nr:hypothetical protein [Nitrososphaerota archaeon]
MLEPQHTITKSTITITAPLSPYKTFANRLRRHKQNTPKSITAIVDTLEADPSIQFYESTIRSKRGNDGYLSENTREIIRTAIFQFATFADLPTTTTAYSDLVKFKRNNPHSADIEQTLNIFADTQPIKSHHTLASYILGLFRANFAPLQLRVNTHFAPAEENCTEGIFQAIYQAQDQETKDMIQWGQYVPERAIAAYRVPFTDIDLTRKDYAIVWIQAQRSKTRTKHPCFVPIDFAKGVIQQANKSGRNCPFPNHQSLWKKLTAFAKQEYKVRLVSNYLRKRYVDIAESTTMPKAQAAFIMGDKTKIALEGIHLDLIYGRGLRFVEELIKNYTDSGLDRALCIEQTTTHPPQTPTSRLQQLEAENTQLKQRLQELLNTLRD